MTDRIVTMGRTAHITEGTKPGLGRSNCQYRNRCMKRLSVRSVLSAVIHRPLPAAENYRQHDPSTQFDCLHEVMYDADSKRATGVRVIDTETSEVFEFKAKVIFLCASAMCLLLPY